MSRKSKAAEYVDEEYSLTINGRNVQVTDAMKDYVIEKLSKIEKFETRIIDVAVTMDVQKFEHRVDIIVKLNQVVIKSTARTEDMYASIDKAIDKIQAQLRKYKQKLQDHHAKPLEVVDREVNVLRSPLNEDIAEVNDDIEAENIRLRDVKYGPHSIVKKETMPLKYLTWDEAVMKMDLSGDDFLVFYNEADRKINVIYRREDDDYGILMAEG